MIYVKQKVGLNFLHVRIKIFVHFFLPFKIYIYPFTNNYLLENLISQVDVHLIPQKYQIVTLRGSKRINYKIKLKMIDWRINYKML